MVIRAQDNPAIGVDLSCTDDLQPDFSLVSGRQLLAEALYRRWTTDRGALLGDPNYGTNLTDYINDDIDALGIAQCQSDCEAEARKDERVVSIKTQASLDNLSSLNLSVEIDDGAGPFTLTLNITSDMVTLFNELGLPNTPPTVQGSLPAILPPKPDYPFNLQLEGWWRAYQGAPWVGTPSQGSSGNRYLRHDSGGNGDPPIGVGLLNGINVAKFTGNLSTIIDLISDDIGQFQSASARSFWMLMQVDPGCVAGAMPWSDFLDYQDLSIPGALTTLSFDEVRPAGPYSATATISGTNTWAFVQGRHDGVNLQLRVNGGAWSTTAAPPANLGGGILYLGYGFKGLIAECAFAKVWFSDTVLNNVRTYINTRYALAV